MFKKYLLSGILALVFASNSLAAEDQWVRIDSRYCTILYANEVDLGQVNKRIDLAPRSFGWIKWWSSSEKKDLTEKLADKFDQIFMKVEEILDMYPRRIQVKVKVFATKSKLDEAYYEIFGEENRASAFYVYRFNTIYLEQGQISEKILAHELAHAIICHYFVILPPKKVQEMLATYVDAHLKD